MRTSLLSIGLLVGYVAHGTPANFHGDDDCRARGFVGVTSEVPNARKLARLGYSQQGGAFVRNVVGCTGAEAAGIRPLDYLIAVDGEPVSADGHFFCLLEDVEPGAKVRVTLLRDGEEEERELTIGERGDACHEETPYPKRGFFGISNGVVDAEPGVIIELVDGGSLEGLGAESGDRLLRVDGHPVNDWDDISTVKRLIDDVDEVSFELERDGESVLLAGAIDARDTGSWSGSWSHDSDDGRQVYVNGERIGAEVDRALAEARAAIDEIDFDEIEREVQAAMDEIDWEEIDEQTREATEQAMEAVREVLGSRGGRGRSTRGPQPSAVSVEEVSPDDVPAAVRDRIGAKTVGDAGVRSFSSRYEASSGELTLAFEAPTVRPTVLRIFSPSLREVYVYDLGDFSGDFSDEAEILDNGAGEYHLVIERGDEVFVRAIQAE